MKKMKMCRWACGHALKDHVRNENIKERMKIEKITDRCMKARLRWVGHVETIKRICGKTNAGDGTAREK